MTMILKRFAVCSCAPRLCQRVRSLLMSGNTFEDACTVSIGLDLSSLGASQDWRTDGHSCSKEPLCCVARLKADLARPICYRRFFIQSDCVSIKGSKEKRKARPSTVPLGTREAWGAWTQNFSRQLPVGKREQKAVINMAASRPSRSEIGQVESNRKIGD